MDPAVVAVSVSELTCQFGRLRALDGLSLQIATGHVVGVVGPNGAGKTTLLDVVSGLVRPTRGVVTVFGEDVALRGRAVRAQLGVVPQETALYEEVSSRQNLRFAAALYDVKNEKARVEEVLAIVGLTARGDDPVSTLSGGMQRRLAMARALLHEPQMLILDEPTLGVDIEARHQIWSHVRKLRGEGKTVLLSTNYLDEAEALCDRVVMLRDGKLVAEDTPRGLLARAGRCVELECRAEEAAGLEKVLVGSPGVLRAERANLGLVVYVEGGSSAEDLVRRAMEVTPLSGFRIRSPDLVEVFRALGAGAPGRTIFAGVRAAWILELQQLGRQRAFVALTVVAALTFLATMSLFGLTGSELPLAVVDDDHGALAARFVRALEGVRHAFAVRPMGAEAAEAALRSGRVIGAVTIPAHFGESVARGDTVALLVRVDNLNTDLTSDLERALPNAILAFGQDKGLPGLRAHLVEKDLVTRGETPFLAYVAVSALGLDALIIAGVLGALAMAREWEGRTVKLLRLAPADPGAIVLGKVLAATGVSALAMLVTTLVVVVGYGISPTAPLGSALALAVSVFSFACVGVCVGALLRRTIAIVPLVFGMAMPLYIDCGALEPTRFDGEWIWRLAHLSPLYYATGLLEWSFHGLRVTPEPVWADAAVLLGLAGVSLALARAALCTRTGAASRSRPPRADGAGVPT